MSMSERKETTLGEVAKFQNGYPFKPAELTGVGLPVVRIKQLLDPSVECDLSDVAVPRNFHVDDGDLIFSWSATLASRIWNRGPAILNQHLFRVIEGAGVERLWLHYVLDHAIDELALKTHGTTMKHVTKKVLQEHQISLPPLPEQRRIVDVMSAVDAQIEALRRESEFAKRALEQCRSLVPNGERVPIGEIIMGIDSGKSVLTAGDLPRSGDPRILKVSAVGSGVFRPSEAKHLSASMPATALVSAGDLLMTRSNTPDRVGYCALAREVPEPTYMPDLIWRIRVDTSRCTASYLEQVLASPEMRRHVTATATGTSASMRKINKKNLAAVRVVVPDLADQEVYVEDCRAVSAVAATLSAEAEALRAFRSSLLTALLSQTITIPEAYDAVLEVAA